EFKKRDDELQRLSNNLRAQAEKFDKDAPVLSETDRTNRQRELSRLDTELQRKRREFQEDFNRRRNEEFSAIVNKANQAIKRIAEPENYDLIVQDAVTVNPRVDITDKVIQALGKYSAASHACRSCWIPPARRPWTHCWRLPTPKASNGILSL